MVRGRKHDLRSANPKRGRDMSKAQKQLATVCSKQVTDFRINVTPEQVGREGDPALRGAEAEELGINLAGVRTWYPFWMQIHNSQGIGSPGQTRTADKVVNSHLLYQLSYRGTARNPNITGLIGQDISKACKANQKIKFGYSCRITDHKESRNPCDEINCWLLPILVKSPYNSSGSSANW